MLKKDAIQLIQALSNAKGAPGFEDEVAKTVISYAQGLGLCYEDKMRNVYVARKENKSGLDDDFSRWDETRRLRIQLDAHMDEVAFMVQFIRPNGMIQMLPLGGWVNSNIPAHQMLVRTKSATYVKGLTTSKPPHFMSAAERERSLEMRDIVLDLGVTKAADLEQLGVEIGAPIVPDVQCEYDEQRDLLLGKAFDCRMGCAAILDCLDTLKGQELEVDVFAAFSTQEEVGTRGAQITVNRVRPDLAIVFEGCPADDTFSEPYESQTKLYQGPMLRHIDARMITQARFQRLALDLARELGIPVQSAVRSGGSTNGAPIHLSQQGVPTIVIGLPVRYIHTSYGMASYFDHKAAVELALALLQKLNRAQYDLL